ncbi:oxygen-independent coproporphyrinogen III oxidase [Hahella sp. CCB-MM4]|uniref:oxygen-independent coproporphyrinogen III oxidase n=1 Tax=Hahella sp. (strain CCB-MM4) TaxID=1926491 RepID=UPI000B9AC812|nr:oxygen-independent coproporphyrinogen III oxidase [Hahella sp. CCB-MM4]OZG73741.1 oxygen-independent coproporphyrinogen III oxidase [Hahella sp. CCB-MM4]
MDNIYWNEQLIRKYDLQGPRYTSYPTAMEFQPGFSHQDVFDAASVSRLTAKPLSLYFHIPFCARLCYYCACNKIVTKRREQAQPYLDQLYREMVLQAALFSKDQDGNSRLVEQLHWGGGTPTFLSPDQMRELMTRTRELFRLLPDDQGDYSIEIDPREADDETLTVLREIGFNRISLGVQDFDPKVQKAVNRVQSEELTLHVLTKARELGFRSINIDLIYGLPFQTESTFARTVDKIIQFSPDRLSVFNYAHMPNRFKPQRRIDGATLPTPQQKLSILRNSVDQLIRHDYRFIGMDHFAKPDDELAIAQSEGHLHRNFQGYTTRGNCDLIAMGVSSISMLDRAYYQNVYDIPGYSDILSQGKLPVQRGVMLNDDDVLRREIIMELICNFKLSFKMIEDRYNISFKEYFKPELAQLKDMEEDGLVQFGTENGEELVRIHPAGRLLIRGICKVFDRYRVEQTQSFSRII